MTSGAQGRAEVIRLLRRHQVKPAKRLGQNFLVDPNTIRKIVALAALHPGDQVVEVGAGTGTLTRELAATGARVVAYEVDERLRSLLEEVVSDFDNVELRFVDAAEAVLASGHWTMVANLPYNLAATLLLDWLANAAQPERFVIMVQREVAERLTAQPGSRIYGLPSVVTRLHATARLAFRVPHTVFYPEPEVESAVIEIIRQEPAALAPAATRLAAAAFGQRRKMLRRSLTQVLDDPEGVLRTAGIDPAARPEEISAAQFLDLAEAERG